MFNLCYILLCTLDPATTVCMLPVLHRCSTSHVFSWSFSVLHCDAPVLTAIENTLHSQVVYFVKVHIAVICNAVIHLRYT